MSGEQSEFGKEVCAVYDETVASAEALAVKHTRVDYKIVITPYDKENDDVPHGASEACFSTSAPLAESVETTWMVMNVPAVKKWFHLSAKYVTVSIECRVKSLFSVHDLTAFYFVSEPTRLNDGQALSEDGDKNWSTTVHVRDNESAAKSWPVKLVWANNRAQVLTSVCFSHHPNDHPRLAQRLKQEATLVKMHELCPLAAIAQKRLSAKRKRDEPVPTIDAKAFSKLTDQRDKVLTF